MTVFEKAISVLHVSASRHAEDFYCERLGFKQTFAYRPHTDDPCYMGVVRDGAEVHLSSFSGDGVAGGVVFLLVDDVDALHEELASRGVTIAMAPTDQTWGNREMYVRDADANSIRFIQPRSRS